MANEPQSLVLELLRNIRAEMATKSELAEVRAEVRSLRADVASDLITMKADNDREHKQTREQIVGLRRAAVEYHSAVIGDGIIISEPESRMRRVEQHLNLPSMETH